MEKVCVGMIGCGTIAQAAHLPAIRAVSNAELIGTCDISESLAKEAAKTWGAHSHFTDYAKLLKMPEIDAVVITLPNFLHEKVTVAAAEAGKHVLCEKPMSCTNKEAERMITACSKAKRILQIGQNQRFFSQNQLAKKLVDHQAIGNVTASRSTFRLTWKVGLTKFRDDLGQSGGLAMMDLTVHRIDLLRWFVGNARRIFGVVKHTTIPQTGFDDNIWIICEFENGGYGCIDTDRFSPQMVNTTELYGTEGTIFLSTEAFSPFQPVPMALFSDNDVRKFPEVEAYCLRSPWEEFPQKRWMSLFPPWNDPYKEQMSHFVHSILDDKPPLVSGYEGAKTIEIALAAFKSTQTGGWVDLPLREEVVPPGYSTHS